MNYHVGRAGQQLGVYPEETIRAMLGRGELRPDDLGWAEGMGAWTPLGQLFPGLTAAATPPPVSGAGAFAAPPPAPGGFGGFGNSGVPPVKPNSNLVPAILVTLFCCLPFGIAAIIFASQVDGKYAAGDYAGAEASAAKAKKWMWWAFGVGLVGTLLYVAMVAVGAASGAMQQ